MGIDQIMFGLVPFCVVTVVGAPLAGYLSDRFGVRRVALTSMILFSFGMMLFSLNNGSTTIYLLLWGATCPAGRGNITNYFLQKPSLVGFSTKEALR